jgi:peptidoglycan/xylan/chitin deacetylase (PgdA/CDA1 family)
MVVTFDDAYRSVLRDGFPLLARLGVPATVFAPTAFVASQEPMAWRGMEEWVGGPHEDELAPMSWEELRQLQAAGWEVGSHSRTHPDLALLDATALEEELGGSRQECEAELQRPCTSLAYPFSSYDDRVKDAARDAGYASGLILDSQLAIPPQSLPSRAGASADRFELVRAGIYRHDGMGRFIAKTSPLVRRARAGKPLRLAMRFGLRRVTA